MSEDGFHEIQLNGKQLVFLFMAATVAAVVIFLCGVLVGRGVPVAHLEAAPNSLEQHAIDPTAGAQPPPAAAADAPEAPSGGEDFTYSRLLESPRPATETIPPAADAVGSRAFAPVAPQEPRVEARPPAADQAPARAKAAAQAAAHASTVTPARNEPRQPTALSRPVSPEIPRSEAAPPVTAAAAPTFAEPPGNGFVVQVAAVKARSEAVVIAQHLGSKGYPAFVTTAGANIFRVRVGKFTDRGAAEAVAGRLEREEQFKPWITR